MNWIKCDDETYYPVFKCSKCGGVIVMIDECFMLPNKCKWCNKEQDSTNQ